MLVTLPEVSADIQREAALVFARNGADGKTERNRQRVLSRLQRQPAQPVHDLFGPGSNPERRYVSSYEEIAQRVENARQLGLLIVYTVGTYDMLHIGHARYIEEARQWGALVIVGVELDSAVKLRKGEHRPVVPLVERVEMLCHLRHVDLVVPILDYAANGLSGLGMLRAIRPDVFIASVRSVDEDPSAAEWLKEVKRYSGHVEVLPSQATTSTSAKIRELVMEVSSLVKQGMDEVRGALEEAIASTAAKITASVAEGMQPLREAIQHAFTQIGEKADEAVRKA